MLCALAQLDYAIWVVRDRRRAGSFSLSLRLLRIKEDHPFVRRQASKKPLPSHCNIKVRYLLFLLGTNDSTCLKDWEGRKGEGKVSDAFVKRRDEEDSPKTPSSLLLSSSCLVIVSTSGLLLGPSPKRSLRSNTSSSSRSLLPSVEHFLRS